MNVIKCNSEGRKESNKPKVINKETQRLDWQTNDIDPTPEIGQLRNQLRNQNKENKTNEGEEEWKPRENKPMRKKTRWNASRKLDNWWKIDKGEIV